MNILSSNLTRGVAVVWLLVSFAPAEAQTLPLTSPAPIAPAASLSQDGFDTLKSKWDTLTTEGLLKAAQTGDARAQYFYWLRERTESREAVDRDFSRQMYFYRRMSEDQSKAAEAKWKSASAAELNTAIAKGDLGAQMILAEQASSQDGKRVADAYEWLKKSADQGFPPAEYDIARHILSLSGWPNKPFDKTNGLRYLQDSAAQGWGKAQYQLGMFYLVGNLIPPDFSQALANFRLAADSGNEGGQYELARLYSQGIGEPRNAEDSPVALLRKAVKKNDILAGLALADRYRTGLGVEIDYVTAIQLYQAARKDDLSFLPAGNDIISDLIDENLDPRSGLFATWSDFAKVLSVFLKATKQKDARAMDQLGDWYQAGRFVPRNPARASYWYNLAAENGSTQTRPK